MVAPQSLLQWASLAVLVSALGLAAMHDLRSYLIPNRFPVALAISFGVFAVGLPLGDVARSILTAAVVFGAGSFLFWRGWLGGGDVKLLAAASLWVPSARFAEFMLTTSIAGAVLALLMMTPLRRCLPRPPDSEADPVLRQPIPYGVAIAAGGLAAAAWRSGI